MDYAQTAGPGTESNRGRLCTVSRNKPSAFFIRPLRPNRTIAQPWDEGDGFQWANADADRMTETGGRRCHHRRHVMVVGGHTQSKLSWSTPYLHSVSRGHVRRGSLGVEPWRHVRQVHIPRLGLSRVDSRLSSKNVTVFSSGSPTYVIRSRPTYCLRWSTLWSLARQIPAVSPSLETYRRKTYSAFKKYLLKFALRIVSGRHKLEHISDVREAGHILSIFYCVPKRGRGHWCIDGEGHFVKLKKKQCNSKTYPCNKCLSIMFFFWMGVLEDRYNIGRGRCLISDPLSLKRHSYESDRPTSLLLDFHERSNIFLRKSTFALCKSPLIWLL